MPKILRVKRSNLYDVFIADEGWNGWTRVKFVGVSQPVEVESGLPLSKYQRINIAQQIYKLVIGNKWG